MEVNPKLLDFLRKNTNLIATGDFTELYKALKRKHPAEADYWTPRLTQLLEEAEIQPLDSMTTIPNFYCTYRDIERYTIPSHIKTIAYQAFRHCSQLKTIELPQGLETIESEAFSECSQLQQINFPSSLQRIGEKAFFATRALDDITYEGSKDQLRKVEVHPLAFFYNTVVHCTDGDLKFRPFSDGMYHGLEQWDYEWREA